MKKLIYSTSLTLLLSLLCFLPLTAQDVFQLDKTSSVKIQGTSTLHDWESVVEKKEVLLTVNNKDGITEISQMELTIETRSIKSGKDVMDIKTYNALKSTEYPSIIFKLNAPVKISSDQEVTAKGTLQLAGVTKDITVTGKVTYDNKAQMGINASYTINMPDYNIDPPTAMFGTIKTGKEVTVTFDMQLTKTPGAN